MGISNRIEHIRRLVSLIAAHVLIPANLMSSWPLLRLIGNHLSTMTGGPPITVPP